MILQCCHCNYTAPVPSSSSSSSSSSVTSSSSSSSSSVSSQAVSTDGCHCEVVPRNFYVTIGETIDYGIGEACCRTYQGKHICRFVGGNGCSATYRSDLKVQQLNPFFGGECNEISSQSAIEMIVTFDDNGTLPGAGGIVTFQMTITDAVVSYSQFTVITQEGDPSGTHSNPCFPDTRVLLGSDGGSYNCIPRQTVTVSLR